MLNIVLFCGGSGCRSIIRGLLEHEDVNLTLLINGYDDGKSTGRLRRYIPGMLGPSDFRKNIGATSTWMYASELLNYRGPDLPNHQAIPDKLPKAVKLVEDWLSCFRSYEKWRPTPFDREDCAFGNILIAGAYLAKRDFNMAVEEVATAFACKARVLNITRGENRELLATTVTGNVLHEEEISTGAYSPITKLFFAPKEAANPLIAIKAANTITDADLLVLGPGTLFSSILPSLKTRGIQSAVAASRAKQIVLIQNLIPEPSSFGYDLKDIHSEVERLLGKPCTLTLKPSEYISSTHGIHDGKKVAYALLELVHGVGAKK